MTRHEPDPPAADVTWIAPDALRVDAEGVTLVGSRCADCGALAFPAARLCVGCGGERCEPAGLSSQGTLYSFSVVHQAASGWHVPYALGYVDLSDGVRVLAHLTGPAECLRIGAAMRLTVGEVARDRQGRALCTYLFDAVARGA